MDAEAPVLMLMDESLRTRETSGVEGGGCEVNVKVAAEVLVKDPESVPVIVTGYMPGVSDVQESRDSPSVAMV